jgi:hypothetical protein
MSDSRTMIDLSRKRLCVLKDELTATEPEPWSDITAWIAKATPIIRSDWPSHFDDFQQITVEPRWTRPRATLSELLHPTGAPPDTSHLAANRKKAEAAKQKILSFLDGLMATSEIELPSRQSVATVFYSWQSDLPNSTNRGFIEDCLERAIKELKADPELKVEPCLDRDTQNVPGSPDISSTIFNKIDRRGLFVCDVSIINAGLTERPTPNPNVLIELGYAVTTLGWNRIVCVFNSTFGEVEKLPFDLRQRRVRCYTLNDGQEKADQRRLLTGLLTADLRSIFDSILPNRDQDGADTAAKCGSCPTLLKGICNAAFAWSCPALVSADGHAVIATAHSQAMAWWECCRLARGGGAGRCVDSRSRTMAKVIDSVPTSFDLPPFAGRWFRWAEIENCFWPGKGTHISCRAQYRAQ